MTTIPNLNPIPAVTGDDYLITHDTATNRSGRVSAHSLKDYVSSGIIADQDIAATDIPYNGSNVGLELDRAIKKVANFSALSTTNANIGEQVRTNCHSIPNFGGALFNVVSSSGLTANTGSIAINGSIAFVLAEPMLFVEFFGADPTGTLSSSAALQAAFNHLGSNYGKVCFKGGTYKFTVKSLAKAGQSVDFGGATLDCTALNDAIVSYNDTYSIPFDFANSYPVTTLENARVKGAGIGWAPGNNNLFIARAKGTPYINVANIACYRAGVLDLIGESFFSSSTNVIVYNPIATCWRLTLGAGTFGPNYTSLLNCEIEEQKQFVSVVYVEAGTVNIEGGLMESVQHAVHLNGASAAARLSNVGIPQRYQEDSASVYVQSGYSLYVDGCDCSFGGRVPGNPAITGSTVRIDSDLKYFTFNNNTIYFSHDNVDTSSAFDIRAFVEAQIDGNTFYKNSSTANASIFKLANSSSAQITGIFTSNKTDSAGSSTLKFVESATLGSINLKVAANKFFKTSNFVRNESNSIESNDFYGPADSIVFSAVNKGYLKNNNFEKSGWSVSNALFKIDNPGLNGTSDNLAPQIQSNSEVVTSLTAGALANVVITVPIPFKDAGYEVTCTAFNTTFGGGSLQVDHVSQQSGSQITVVVKNNSASTASGKVMAIFAYNN